MATSCRNGGECMNSKKLTMFWYTCFSLELKNQKKEISSNNKRKREEDETEESRKKQKVCTTGLIN